MFLTRRAGPAGGRRPAPAGGHRPRRRRGDGMRRREAAHGPGMPDAGLLAMSRLRHVPTATPIIGDIAPAVTGFCAATHEQVSRIHGRCRSDETDRALLPPPRCPHASPSPRAVTHPTCRPDSIDVRAVRVSGNGLTRSWKRPAPASGRPWSTPTGTEGSHVSSPVHAGARPSNLCTCRRDGGL